MSVGTLQSVEIGNPCLAELKFNPPLVKHLLQEHEEGQKKIEDLGQRKLGAGLKITLWGLRAYVVFMLVVVGINVAQLLH